MYLSRLQCLATILFSIVLLLNSFCAGDATPDQSNQRHYYNDRLSDSEGDSSDQSDSTNYYNQLSSSSNSRQSQSSSNSYAECDPRKPDIETKIHHGGNEINYGVALPEDVIGYVDDPDGPCGPPPECSNEALTKLPTNMVGGVKHGPDTHPVPYNFSVNVTQSHYGTRQDLQLMLYAAQQSLNASNNPQAKNWTDKHTVIHKTQGFPASGSDIENWNTAEVIVARYDGDYRCGLLHIVVTIPGFQPTPNTEECDSQANWLADVAGDVVGNFVQDESGIVSRLVKSVGAHYFGTITADCG